jgi:ribosomal RNA-processing protein 9
MLRSKRKPNNRNEKNPRIKQMSLEEKLKNKKFNGKQKDDEEILSGSEDDNEGGRQNRNDKFFEDDDNKKSKSKEFKRPSETADAKRLRLAKKLITKIGDEIKNKEEDGGSMMIDEEANIDQYIIDEIKKDNNDYYLELSSSSNFNPTSGSLIKGHLSSITDLDISSDSKYVISVSKDCRAIKWDLTTGKKLLLPEFTKKPLYACVFTPDNKYGLFGGADRFIYQMELGTEKIVQSFKAHNDAITGIVFDQNKDQYYTCSRDNTLKVWAVATAQKSILIETFYGHTDKINQIDIMSGSFGEKNTTTAATNRIITCGSDRQISLWKIDTQSFLQFKEAENIFSYDCVKSLDNDFFLSSSYDGSLNLWRTNKKKPILKINNSHGFEKTVSLNHSFFSKSIEDNYNSLSHDKAVIRTLDKQDENVKTVMISYPILSLATIKNSDLIFTGSSDGFLNVYKFTKSDPKKNVKEKLELLKKINIENKGCINCIKVNKTNEFLVLGHGKDGRLGRWDCKNKTKNGISIVKLFDN